MFLSCRMNSYKHKSGAQKRKELAESEEKKRKLPKITSFFNAKQSTSVDSAVPGNSSTTNTHQSKSIQKVYLTI